MKTTSRLRNRTLTGFFSLIAPGLLLFPAAAGALPPGTCITCPVRTCYSGGGYRTCGSPPSCYYEEEPAGTACRTDGSTGQCNGQGTCLLDGTVTPRYYIGAVYYAPPAISSSAQYTSTSQLGSDTSITNTFQDSLKIDATDGFFGLGSIEITSTNTWGTSSTADTDIILTNTAGYTINGTADIIDHGADIIWFLINPLIDLTYSPASASLAWNFDENQPESAVSYAVYARWVCEPSTMPQPVSWYLGDAGFTPTDYAHLCAADPFGSTPYVPDQAMDPNRWDYITDFPYIPELAPLAPGEKPNTITYALSRNDTTADTNVESSSYAVGVTLSTGLIFTS